MSNGEKLALLMSHLFIIGWLVFLGISIHEFMKPKKKKEVKKRKQNLEKPMYGRYKVDEQFFDNPNGLNVKEIIIEQNKSL